MLVDRHLDTAIVTSADQAIEPSKIKLSADMRSHSES